MNALNGEHGREMSCLALGYLVPGCGLWVVGCGARLRMHPRHFLIEHEPSNKPRNILASDSLFSLNSNPWHKNGTS